MTLEKLLSNLVDYGKPSLFFNEGWVCSIDMNTNTKGVNFQIRSEHRHATALDAALQCQERVLTAVMETKAIKELK